MAPIVGAHRATRFAVCGGPGHIIGASRIKHLIRHPRTQLPVAKRMFQVSDRVFRTPRRMAASGNKPVRSGNRAFGDFGCAQRSMRVVKRLGRIVKRNVGTSSVWWEYADAKYERTKVRQALRERAHMRIISCRSSTVICDTRRGRREGG